MTDHALYARQEALHLAHPSVTIVGCGGVGCWAALALALGGCERLVLFDADTISLHNLNRFPLSTEAVGQPKSQALASWLLTLRPNLEIDARGLFDSQLHQLRTDWVVCCTDSLKSRRMVHTVAANSDTKYLELGADGERWTLSNEPPQFTTELELDAGYTSVPVHVGPCMMAGAAAAYYVLHDCVPPGDHLCEWDVRNRRLNIQAYMPAAREPELAEAIVGETGEIVQVAQLAQAEPAPRWIEEGPLPDEIFTDTATTPQAGQQLGAELGEAQNEQQEQEG